MPLKTSEHTNIHDAHPGRLKNLHVVASKEQRMQVVPKPTKRFLKKMELDYQYCPDCESQDIIFYGKTSVGEQKHRCKECGYQFISQFDSIFPKSRRRWIFEEEYLSNLKTIGFKKGCGRQIYWSGALMETLQMLESNAIKIRFNRMVKSMPIRGDKDYKILLEFIVGEAYNGVVE